MLALSALKWPLAFELICAGAEGSGWNWFASEARERELRIEYNHEARAYNQLSHRLDAHLLIRLIGFPDKLLPYQPHTGSAPL